MKIFIIAIAIAIATMASEPSIFPHAEQDSLFGGQWIPGKEPSVRARCRPHEALTHEVYGFLPYWEYGGYLPSRFDLLSRIAYFNVTLDGSGNVSTAHDWPTTTLIDAAHASGCKVDLCVAVFNSSTIASIVNNPANRTHACHTICEQMALGADGVNIDFEMPSSSDASGFYAFLREFADSVHSRGADMWASVCLPAVDWRGTFDADSLLPHLDALFLMGYGYYWSGSSTTGPVAPLDDDGCTYDIAYSVSHYCGGDAFKRSHFIVGLPLYGYDWPCSGTYRGASTTGSGSAKIYSTCAAETLSYGCNWDADAPCPWYVHGSYSQCWWDDARSLDVKYRWSVSNGLMGIGYWALGYDNNDAVFWNGIQSVFGGDFPRDTIIDDVSFGFEKSGGASFWHEADTGYFGRMWWTRSTVATDPADDTCFCTWTPNLPDRRFYQLFVYIAALNGVASARYAVEHDFGTDTVVVRQADYFDEWVSLGTFSFEAGAGGSVYLGDGTGISGEQIGFDAIWWSDRGALPAPDTLVTISSDGFRWKGPIAYRRIVAGGIEGTTYWTNSITHPPDVNGAWWRPQLPMANDYAVYVYVPFEHAEASVTYKINHAFGLATVVLDQSAHHGEWVRLGSWRFVPGDSVYLYVGDCTGTSGENIAIDAAVWRSAPLNIAGKSLPTDLAISAYPNPFNSLCRIEIFGKPDAPLKIFDLAGHEIKRFDLPNKKNNIIIWNGRDFANNDLPSGIYMIKCAGCYQKITLLR